jgi:dihydrofolate reductase
MRKLTVFTQLTLNGYFADRKGDMGWAHKDKQDAEWNAFVADNAGGGGMLLFGRITYELMASYWPTPYAAKNDPVVAERMNSLRKVVFSTTLKEATWSNTKLVKSGVAEEVRKMKKEPGEDMAILGSGSIAAQLAQEGLIDEYKMVINPLLLGAGKTMFEGIKEKLCLTLTTREPSTMGPSCCARARGGEVGPSTSRLSGDPSYRGRRGSHVVRRR